jgi:hypothetical protein
MKLRFAGPDIAGILILAVAVPASQAQSAADACSLLTQAQVSAAVGAQVSEGQYVTPTFKATCTWTTSGKIVTLMTESAGMYDTAKAHPIAGFQITPASGIGDDAYYVTIGTMVSLFTKKGNVAFKTSVYSQLPADTLKKMESTLAQQVASEL